MARTRPPRSSLIPPAPVLFRLISFLFMLGVIGITIYRLSPWRRNQMADIADAPRVGIAERRPAPAGKDEPPETPARGSLTEDESDGTTNAAPKAAPTGDDEPAVSPGEPTGIELADEPAPTADDAIPAPSGAIDDSDLIVRADDRDPRQMAAFRWEIRLVNDYSQLVQGYELPAYKRLFRWISDQSVEQLAAREPPAASFQQLMQHPDKYRGELLSIDLTIRRVELDPGDTRDTVGVDHVYQLWGWPTSGRGWLYVVVTPELPPGFSIGEEVSQTARGVRLFLQGTRLLSGQG